jgi:hypothetical protein
MYQVKLDPHLQKCIMIGREICIRDIQVKTP